MKTAKNYATAAGAAVLLTGLVSVFGAGAGSVWTNDMWHAEWGYEVCGLGEKGDEIALVYTNCAADANISWDVPDNVHTFKFLVVGGGGGGAASQAGSVNQRPGGGGGGGGVVEGDVVIPAGTKTIGLVVGAGGKRGSYTNTTDSSAYSALPGGDSKLVIGGEDWVIAYGGGAGGRLNKDGGAGGCGGGAGCNPSPTTGDHVGGAATSGAVAEKGAALTANVFGFPGGDTPTSVGQTQGAGGGGAGAKGEDAKKSGTAGVGGAGGAGHLSDITGSSVRYAGGGGGGNTGSAASAVRPGGAGGGGNGGVSSSSKANIVAAQPGADGFGGGGGAGGNYAAGARGGSGVVIIRFAEGAAPAPKDICYWTGKGANNNWTQRENWTNNLVPAASSFVKFPEIDPGDPLAVWNVVVNKSFSNTSPACDNFTAENGMVISGGNPLFAYVNKDAENPYQMFFNGWDGRTLCVTGAGTSLEICRKSYTNGKATFQRGVLFAKDGGMIRVTGLSFSDNYGHRMVASNANSRIEFKAEDKKVLGAEFNGYEVAGNYKQVYEAHDGGMVTLNSDLTFAKQSWPTFVADGGWINFGTQDGTSYKFNATLQGSSTLIADHGGTIRMGGITPQDAPVVGGSVSFPGTTETVDGVGDTVIECRNNGRIRFSGAFNLPGQYTSVPTLSISGENPRVQAEDASVLGSSKTGAMEFLIAPQPSWSATDPRVESIFSTLTIYANVRYTIDLSAFASMTANFRFAIAGAGDGKALSYTAPTTPVKVVGLSEGTYEVALVKEDNILYLDVDVKHPYTMLMLK